MEEEGGKQMVTSRARRREEEAGEGPRRTRSKARGKSLFLRLSLAMRGEGTTAVEKKCPLGREGGKKERPFLLVDYGTSRQYEVFSPPALFLGYGKTCPLFASSPTS